MRYKSGFTIVELLIVIVVIGILAAITIVAYNGIQQRANNASIISAAKNAIGIINGYVAANSSYPATSSGCLTLTSGCVINGTVFGSNTTLNNSLATLGTVPNSIPQNTGNRYGITYSYVSTRTYNGDVQPAIVVYWLFGTGQQCGISNVVSGWTTGVSSTTGYSSANDGGQTLCYIYIPGPSS